MTARNMLRLFVITSTTPEKRDTILRVDIETFSGVVKLACMMAK